MIVQMYLNYSLRKHGVNKMSSPSTAISTEVKTGNKFLLLRLHSLAGIVPLGLFIIEHLISNATAVLGSEAYNRQIELLHSIPFLPVLEVLFIFLPLVYHAVYGIYIAYISKNNALSYKYARNWMFFLQRVTGVITLIFVVYHVWSLRISNVIYGTEVNFQIVQEYLMNPWIALFYILGVLSTTFHFANGLWTGLITWGVTLGPKSQRISGRIMFTLFIILSTMGIASVLSFWNS